MKANIADLFQQEMTTSERILMHHYLLDMKKKVRQQEEIKKRNPVRAQIVSITPPHFINPITTYRFDDDQYIHETEGVLALDMKGLSNCKIPKSVKIEDGQLYCVMKSNPNHIHGSIEYLSQRLKSKNDANLKDWADLIDNFIAFRNSQKNSLFNATNDNNIMIKCEDAEEKKSSEFSEAALSQIKRNVVDKKREEEILEYVKGKPFFRSTYLITKDSSEFVGIGYSLEYFERMKYDVGVVQDIIQNVQIFPDVSPVFLKEMQGIHKRAFKQLTTQEYEQESLIYLHFPNRKVTINPYFQHQIIPAAIQIKSFYRIDGENLFLEHYFIYDLEQSSTHVVIASRDEMTNEFLDIYNQRVQEKNDFFSKFYNSKAPKKLPSKNSIF